MNDAARLVAAGTCRAGHDGTFDRVLLDAAAQSLTASNFHWQGAGRV